MWTLSLFFFAEIDSCSLSACFVVVQILYQSVIYRSVIRFNGVSAFVRRIHHLVILFDLACYKSLSFVLILSPEVVMVMVVYRARRFCEQKKQQSRQRKSRRAEDPAPFTQTAVTEPPCIDIQTCACSVYPESHRLALSAKEVTVLERS